MLESANPSPRNAVPTAVAMADRPSVSNMSRLAGMWGSGGAWRVGPRRGGPRLIGVDVYVEVRRVGDQPLHERLAPEERVMQAVRLAGAPHDDL